MPFGFDLRQFYSTKEPLKTGFHRENKLDDIMDASYSIEVNMSDCCQSKKIIKSENAPKALGPYSMATATEELVFTSGQLGIYPETGDLAEGVEAQTRQALKNVEAVLKAAGSCLDCVLKTTVFLKSMGDFAAMNAVYAEFFTSNFPARSAVEVAALPKGGLVEIETIARICQDQA